MGNCAGVDWAADKHDVLVADETGAEVLVLPPSVGGVKDITDYFKLFDYDIAKLKQAFDATK